MAIQNQPGFIPAPFANSGTKNVIPETMPTPSASAAASWTDGFPTVCSLPLASGGIPPARADFNGLFNSITQAQAFYQSGGVYEWDATVDYGTNRMILGSDGKLYWSVAQSGPNIVAGAQDPTTDATHIYWNPVDIANLDADIQSKVALDGSNASSIGKTLSTYMAHAANIDYAHYITVSLPYVAPEDGWMYFETQAYLQNPDVQVYYTLGDHAGCVYRLSWNSSTYTIGAASIVPVPKGARVYMNAGTLDKVEFYYANGSTIY